MSILDCFADWLEPVRVAGQDKRQLPNLNIRTAILESLAKVWAGCHAAGGCVGVLATASDGTGEWGSQNGENCPILDSTLFSAISFSPGLPLPTAAAAERPG